MRIRIVRRPESEDNKFPMTAMIDIVFLLLVFFVSTFKIAVPEGDLNIAMPAAAGTPGPHVETLHVRLTATRDGQLAGIYLGDQHLPDMSALRRQVISLGSASGATGSAWRVELDCDHELRYRHVVAAISASTAYTDADGNLIHLVNKVDLRSRPPRQERG